jgi:hypothetical protein
LYLIEGSDTISLIGSTKTELPKYHTREKNTSEDAWEESHSDLASLPSKLHEDRISPPKFPHFPQTKKRMAEILSVMMPLEPLLPVEVDNILS